jgi:uncharacterized protein (TIGR02145 family)
MRNFLLGVACFLSVSMSVTMSAQADINDYMKAQVTGTEIFMEYDHQMMIDAIDALTTQLNNASSDPCSNLATVTYGVDTYDLVAIGDQCWFAENLRTEYYANGDVIPSSLDDAAWGSTTAGAVTVYGEGTSGVYSGNDDEVVNLATYGRLYNWYAAVDVRGLCPTGWHVPQDSEFKTLEMELGMSESQANGMGLRGTDQGTQMMSSASDLPAWNGTNTSGFSGLAGGNRNYNGDFNNGGSSGVFWSASAYGTDAWRRRLNGGSAGVSRNSYGQRSGFSVRCVRD